MSKNSFDQMRQKAIKEFGDDERKLLLASDAVDLAEQWLKKTNLSYEYVRVGLNDMQLAIYKAELKKFVKAGLWQRRSEGRYGFFGSFVLAVFFAVIVQLIARWIIKNFFD